MINRNPSTKVYLAAGTTDMRKSFNGLTAKVQECFSLDLFNQNIFVFCNKKRDRIKLLQWDRNGFWLHYKRLENGTFNWPGNNGNEKTIEISDRQLSWLLDGLEIEQKQAHKKVKIYKVV